MLNKDIKKIIDDSKSAGWIIEPEAKRLFEIFGLSVPAYKWAHSPAEATEFAEKIGYPVVAKIVSPRVLHKSEVHGVIISLDSSKKIEKAYSSLSGIEGFNGVLIEEMIAGQELIIGAKIDYQFGPVVLMGIGGTGVEIYHDVTMRMAPLDKTDAISMVESLKGKIFLKGFRGSKPINMNSLTDMLIKFSSLIAQLETYIESIDLNPVICSSEKCVIADARIILNKES